MSHETWHNAQPNHKHGLCIDFHRPHATPAQQIFSVGRDDACHLNPNGRIVRIEEIKERNNCYEHSVDSTCTTFTFNAQGLWEKVEKNTCTIGQDKDKDGNVKEKQSSTKSASTLYSGYEIDAQGNVTRYTETSAGNKSRTVNRSIIYY